ncbi:MAG: linear amide C-N hydrolase [Candidatus Latescibacterota bacterium]|nr:MAG: linear amide C-N hydrolase [Candidatus Latescibacterota bacterium]
MGKAGIGVNTRLSAIGRGLTLSTALLVLLVPTLSRACSVFAFSRGNEVVYGQNLDWHDYFPGQVIVNKRGVKKEILPWKKDWPTLTNGAMVTWVSRYGSVTFTCYGRDFIEGGMNEAGLVVDETNLWAIYPPDDGRPGVSCPQWMQYQLDNFATVDEVLAHLDDLRPDGEGWHYLVSDSTGQCAVIEYLRGEVSVYAGDSIEVCALTNTTYKQALSHVPLDAAFGGEIDIGSGSDSYGRFVRIAALLRDYDRERDGAAADYAFRVLRDVSSDETLRSVVYDAGRSRVLWKTRNNPSIRWLDLKALDLSRNTSTWILDVEAGGPGDVSALLEDYSVEANRAVVTRVLGRSRGEAGVINELEARGLTFDRALEMIIQNPASRTRKTQIEVRSDE